MALALLVATPQRGWGNVVGYYNVALPGGGWKLITNQLKPSNANANFVIMGAPDGTCLYRYDPVKQDFYDGATYSTNKIGWWPVSGDTNDIALTLNVGESFFIWSPRPWTNTFVGEILAGRLTNAIPQFYSLKGSMLPIAGRVSTDLAFPGAANDNIFQWATSGYTNNLFDPGTSAWKPTEPFLGVGEGFMVYAPQPKSWIRISPISILGGPANSPQAQPLTAASGTGPQIRAISLQDGQVILQISNPSGSAYGVQFSSDGSSWKDVASGLTGNVWQQPAPGGAAGYYQLVAP